MPIGKHLSKILCLAVVAAFLLLPGVSSAQSPIITSLDQTAPTTVQTSNTASPGTSGTFTAPGEKTEVCPDIWQTGGVLCGALRIFRNVSLWVGYLIGAVAAFFISLAASLIQILIGAGTKVLTNPLVTEGFKISLSITNLGFVLAIIVVAFTTMFRVSGYETKKILRNLVLAAVLVNFSFLIAGAIIDFGNVFGNFFISAASPGAAGFSNFASNLANSLNLQKLSNIKPANIQSVAGALEGLTAGYVGLFISTFATAIFAIFLVIIFFAIAFMLLARYVYLTILLILMPLAWLAWVFPGFGGYFSEWWKLFLKWMLFYPAVSFFLYLGILSSQKVGQLVQAGIPQQITQSAGELANMSTDVIVSLLQIFVQVGILLGGLMAAQRLGLEGANTAMGFAGKVKNWAIGASGKAAARPFTLTGTEPVKRLAQGTANLLNKATWLPGAKTAVAGLTSFSTRKVEIEGYQKQYLTPLTDKQLEERLAGGVPATTVERAALLAEAAARKKVGKITKELPPGMDPNSAEGQAIKKANDEKLSDYVKAAKATNPALPTKDIPSIKAVLETNPAFAETLITIDPQFAKNAAEAVKSAASKIRSDKAMDINTADLKNSVVAMNLSPGVISTIHRDDPTGEKIKNLNEGLAEAVGPVLKKLSDEIATAQKEAAEAKATGDKDELENIKKRLKGLFQVRKGTLADPTTTEEQKAAYAKLQLTYQRIGNI